MSKNKFYAVRKGRSIGVFTSWTKCEESIKKFSGAEYKSFESKEDADQYLMEINTVNESVNTLNIDNDEIVAYVDGSYNDELKAYGSGVVMISADRKIQSFKNAGNDKDLVGMRNVAGEIMASVFAMKYAVDNNFKKLYLYYDYEGIKRWCTGEWKTNKIGTRDYKQFYDDVNKSLCVEFIKVKAHSGDLYNDMADKLAKLSLVDYGSLDKSRGIDKEQDNIYLINKFYKIINTKDKSKNVIEYKFDNLTLTDGKLIKFVKEIWKSKGNKISDMDTLSMNIDMEELLISWNIVDKSGVCHNFGFSLEGKINNNVWGE